MGDPAKSIAGPRAYRARVLAGIAASLTVSCLLTTSLDGVSGGAGSPGDGGGSVEGGGGDGGAIGPAPGVDAGGGADDGGRDGASTIVVPESAVIACEDNTCKTATEVCCERLSASNRCASKEAGCSGHFAECDDAIDCGGAGVCCRTKAGDDRCVARAECDGYEVCNDTSGCPPGMTCGADSFDGFNRDSRRCR